MLQSPVATGGSVVGTGVGGGADVLLIPLDRFNVSVEQVSAITTIPTINSGIRFKIPISKATVASNRQGELAELRHIKTTD